MNSLEIDFTSRLEKFKAQAEALQKTSDRFSMARLLVFVTSLILIVYFANQREAYLVGLVTLLFLVVFGFIVSRHNGIKLQKKRLELKALINDRENKMLNHKWEDIDPGLEFMDENHTYSSDLDIFGKGSLFQLLNRTSTEGGKKELTAILLSPGNIELMAERQEASMELQNQIDWRQDFQVSGLLFRDKESKISEFIHWMKNPGYDNKWLNPWMGIFLGLTATVLIALFFIINISFSWVLVSLAVNGLILKAISREVSETTEKSEHCVQSLKSYSEMIRMIEGHSFQSKIPEQLQGLLIGEDYQASREILRLQKVLHKLLARNNGLFWIANIVFLVDIFWLLEAERWKKRLGNKIESWFECVHKLEAINSIAGFSNAHTDFVYPEIADSKYVFKASNLGHPLIPTDHRIVNDFSIIGKGKIAVVTGSNMSGKSTFLRTIGVNSILAKIGSSVCAKAMSLSEYELFTSMRTHDDLDKNISSFYAELKRIGLLLNLLDQQKPILILLDEILKGTNSTDRHLGAEALIKQLASENCFGLVSTHDLELGKLAVEVPNLENYSFNSKINGEEISFDYKLQKGICYSFNASKLMQKMGIKLNKESP